MVIQHQTRALRNSGERGGQSLSLCERMRKKVKGRGSEAGTLEEVFWRGCWRVRAMKSREWGVPSSSKSQGMGGTVEVKIYEGPERG